MLSSLPLADPTRAKVVWIADTLSVANMVVSESLGISVDDSLKFLAFDEPKEMLFDDNHQLMDL